MTWSRHGKGWRLTAVLALGVLLVLSAPGCAGKDEEGGRSIPQLVSVNNNVPLQSDLYDNGPDKKPNTADDVGVPEDLVRLEITSRPHDPALTLMPGRPFGTVTFNRYTLDFSDNDLDDDGSDDLHDFVNFPMYLVVPINGVGIGSFLAVPASWKTQGALYSALVNSFSYTTTVSITLYGEEETSHDKVELHTAMVVSFADYSDQ